MTIADLSHVPSIWDRFRIEDDFAKAMTAWSAARRELAYQLPGWRFNHRFELRAAIRAWKRYASAVRSRP